MLTKLVDTSSFYKRDEPQVSIIDTAHVDGLVKVAADNRIMDFARGIQVEANKIYLHILAMGAGEFYGSNRNSDYFPEANLVADHQTFETAPAHVFRNHVNKDPAIAIGKVLFSIYNDRMHRVELVAEVDTNKAPDIKQRIDNGDWPFTSMACRTPYDVCSICSNKARTKQEYCSHVTDELGKIFPDGRKVQLLNVAPLKFFDISIVFRPADVTSSVLQKLAADAECVTSSVDEAEAVGLDKMASEKKASLKKIADLLKEIEGNVVGIDPTLHGLISKVSDPSLETIGRLKDYELNEVLSTLGHMGITPSIAFLAELIAQKFLGDEGMGMGAAAADIVKNLDRSETPSSDMSFGEPTEPVLGVAGILMPSMHKASLIPEYVEKRAYGMYISDHRNLTPVGNIGFANNGPYVEERPQVLPGENHFHIPLPKTTLFKALLSVGAAALAAKWYITQVIEKKIKKAELQRRDQGAKIVLVKSASDYRLTYGLAKASMIQALPAIKHN